MALSTYTLCISKKSMYPTVLEKTLNNTLIPSCNGLEIVLANNSTLDGFNAVLKFISTTNILDFLFPVESHHYQFEINAIEQFKLRTKITRTLKKYQNWIDRHIEIIDGKTLSENPHFQKIFRWTEFLGMDDLYKKLNFYNKNPFNHLGKKIKEILIKEVYSLKDIEPLYLKKMESLSEQRARHLKNKIDKLDTLHYLFFNTINAIRSGPKGSILNQDLQTLLIEHISDIIFKVDTIEINYLHFFKKFYHLFTQRSFENDFITIDQPNSRIFDFMNITQNLNISKKKESFFVFVERFKNHPPCLAPITMTDEGSVSFNITGEQHEYLIKEAIIYIGDEDFGFNAFIERFQDTQGIEQFRQHKDDEIMVISKNDFLKLVSTAVLMHLTLKVVIA